MLCKDFEIKISKNYSRNQDASVRWATLGLYELSIIFSELLQAVCWVLLNEIETFPKTTFFTSPKEIKRKKMQTLKGG